MKEKESKGFLNSLELKTVLGDVFLKHTMRKMP